MENVTARVSEAEVHTASNALQLENKDSRFAGLMPLMNTAFEPGKCKDVIKVMEEGAKKEIAVAEYYYFGGHPEEAVKKAELYLTCQDTAVRLSACLFTGMQIFQSDRSGMQDMHLRN